MLWAFFMTLTRFKKKKKNQNQVLCGCCWPAQTTFMPDLLSSHCHIIAFGYAPLASYPGRQSTVKVVCLLLRSTSPPTSTPLDSLWSISHYVIYSSHLKLTATHCKYLAPCVSKADTKLYTLGRCEQLWENVDIWRGEDDLSLAVCLYISLVLTAIFSGRTRELHHVMAYFILKI